MSLSMDSWNDRSMLVKFFSKKWFHRTFVSLSPDCYYSFLQINIWEEISKMNNTIEVGMVINICPVLVLEYWQANTYLLIQYIEIDDCYFSFQCDLLIYKESKGICYI